MKRKTISRFGWGILVLIAGLMLSPALSFAEPGGQVATVKVTPLKKAAISQTLVAYGTVIPAPGAVEVFSVPYESQVRRIFVSPGEEVSPGDLLARMAPSPDTRLAVETAKTDFEMARSRFKAVLKRQKLKLATNEEVFQARQAYTDARLKYDHYKKMDATVPQVIKADRKGIVGHVYEREGAVVQPGGALVDVVAGGALEVRLGGEPEDVNGLKPGQAVSLLPVNRPAAGPVKGRIRAVSRAINPSTRLVNIFVTPDNDGKLMLNEFIQGKIVVASAHGFVVPRSAVLFSNGHGVLFTVENNHARKHIVSVGIQTPDETQVIGKGLAAGADVVILGNYELKNGMAVKVEESR